jgi:vacuolar protein-sorting-associated protein 4
MDIKSDELLEPDLVLQDFIRAVQTARPTVNEKDVAQHTNFTNDFGNVMGPFFWSFYYCY